MKNTIVMLMFVLLGLTACSNRDGLEMETASFYLKRAQNCGEVEQMVRDQAVARMEAELDASMESLLDAFDCDGWRTTLDSDYSAEANPSAGLEKETDEAADDYTTTNNQVSGVDEADFVKNDGSHIYILASGQFQIVEAWPAENAVRLSTFEIEGEPKKMFVHNDRAVIYSSLGAIDTSDPSFDHYYGGECTYGYSCDFTGDGHRLKMTVLDISDMNAPQLLRESTFNSSYLNARRIDDAIYTLTVSPEPEINFEYETWPEELQEYRWACRDEIPYHDMQIKTMFHQLKLKNLERLGRVDISQIIPSIEDVVYENQNEIMNSARDDQCQNFYLAQDGDGTNIMSLVSFDIGELEPLQTTSIIGAPGAVYASGESLYIASRHQRDQMHRSWYFDDDDAQATTIHKFGLKPESHSSFYTASGIVKGHLLNQFSMDEYEAHLRIATTTGHVPDPNVHSTVSIFKQVEGDLVLTGQIDQIAPTEDIRSARFNGDTGFVVTFKKTDPLFVLDLSDPNKPRVEGELKIPGYSTYMHLMDDSHLLTIGYDADDQGDFAWFQGIQLQIIDVSDLKNPQLIHREVIGTRGSSSEAAANHLAFTFFRSRNWLAIPMTVCEDAAGGGSYGYNMTFSGLMVYETAVDNGFSFLGGVPHAEPTSGDDYYSTCGSWWTNPNTQVKRSIFMEDYVYSIALDQINISNVGDLANPVSTVSLTD